HARDQRRTRVCVLGPARSASDPVLRSRRRGARARVAQYPCFRRRPAVHEALVGARPADRLRAHVHAPVLGVRAVRGKRPEPAADVPGRAGDRPRHRCGAGVGEVEAMGARSVGRARGTMMMKHMAMLAFFIVSGVVLLALQQPPAGAPGQTPARGRGGFRQPDPIDFNEHDGWTSLFDGKTLTGWSGDNNWKVENGAITIE